VKRYALVRGLAVQQNDETLERALQTGRRMSLISERPVAARLLGEFFVIVVGVFVAFQVEDWTDARENVQRETILLEALLADFDSNRENFRATVRSEQVVLDRARELLAIMDRGDAPTADSVVFLASRSFAWHTVEPVTGAYDAMISSGELGLIRDSHLRREMAEFFGLLAAGFEDHADLMGLLQLIYGEIGAYIPELKTDDDRAGLGLPPTDHREAAEALLRNERFAGLLYMKTTLEMNRLSRQRDLLDRVERISGMIGASLGSM
jgi:hypothetical protein